MLRRLHQAHRTVSKFLVETAQRIDHITVSVGP